MLKNIETLVEFNVILIDIIKYNEIIIIIKYAN